MARLELDLASKRLRKRSDYGYHLEYRLRWNDNDIFGHVNNPNYGVLADSIINEYMIKECGYTMNKHQQAAIIANTYFDYFGSVSYPDVLGCGLRIVKLGKSSVMYEVGIFRRGDEDVKAVGGSTHVFVTQIDGQLGKPAESGMPNAMRQGYERLIKRTNPHSAL
ncbi:uncharacterized protein A1O5_06889 [Cladophialophora psammophila CBS 110553]|uniref:Thioesterase domain-containing protein n=1 Tax=Cladophialophora psammophila CBS 110553 TaxID=1182543 RepID=W9WNN8_9EURO|nr:uncharacterized protein A1O5_06889 [Cladophialophora psammophila CBS 110553]EXJ69817.1 hypothetical protein A1O5_06889 [Cladophialophora psammophila CBS 110553]